MNQTTKETRRRSYDAVLPKRAARCRLILETLGNRELTALYVTSDGNGELVVAEMVPQVPGQMNMDGTQQEAPKLLKLVQHG